MPLTGTRVINEFYILASAIVAATIAWAACAVLNFIAAEKASRPRADAAEI